jgi:hypothetical protein
VLVMIVFQFTPHIFVHITNDVTIKPVDYHVFLAFLTPFFGPITRQSSIQPTQAK